MAQDDDGVDVTFASGGTRRFDLVAGADGLHSITRTLTFGDEAPFEWYCGYQVAVFTTDNYLGLDHANMLINCGIMGFFLSLIKGKFASLSLPFFFLRSE